MKKKLLNKHNLKRKNAGRFWKILAIFYFTLMTSFILYHVYYAKRIIPGVYANGFYLGGMEIEDAVKYLSDNSPYDKNYVSVVVNDTEPVIINPTDINFKVLYVTTVKDAFSVGRSGNVLYDFIDKISVLKDGKKVPFSYDFSEIEMQNRINSIADTRIKVMEEPSFQISESGELYIKDGNSGESFDEDLPSRIANGLAGNADSLISVTPKIVTPKFSRDDLESLKSEFQEIINVDYEVVFELYSRKISKEEVLSFFEPVKEGGVVNLLVKEDKLRDYLGSIALEIDRSPRVQVLKVEAGRALEFVAPENGQKLKINESVDEIRKALVSKVSKINLSVEVTSPPENENSYGVKEIVGVGHSKFKGSIPGRVANVGLAASRVNGVLVAPGEIFSFNEAVGEISAKTGYSTAYVISRGRTVLGDGGGVCQVSTTLFRAALDAGLPIVERNAHSYRVNYYEQDSAPGIDATIYSPSVDLRFKNDTPGYLLITSDFSAKDFTLSFTIYGTSDGRSVEMTNPVILSRTPPPETIYEPDPSLPTGVKKQVEHSVWGASVKFDRTVKSKDGVLIYKDTFKSNYRPWGAVYKIGV